jgi:RNA polymerase sigma factor (sigma-70 family)
MAHKNKRPVRELTAVSAAFLENTLNLKRFLTRYVSSQRDIEDVVQETYLRAFVSEQRKNVAQPQAFLFRIARNIALTALTRKSRQITDYIEDLASADVLGAEASADAHMEAEQLLGIYCEAVATLPQKCREVFLLRKVHGLSHKEIATRMSLSASSVEKYLQQALLTCRDFIRHGEGHAAEHDVAVQVSISAKRQK